MVTKPTYKPSSCLKCVSTIIGISAENIHLLQGKQVNNAYTRANTYSYNTALLDGLIIVLYYLATTVITICALVCNITLLCFFVLCGAVFFG